MNILLDLFLTYAKIGVVTFGGGYSMLPMFEREIVEKKHWCTNDELMDYFALSRCTPGVIAVNNATFVGHKMKGTLGAACATLGVIFPSIVIILIVAAILGNFTHYEIVQHAFNGVRAAVAVLVLVSVAKLFKSSVKDVFGLVLCIATFVIAICVDISPIVFVIATAILGILYFKIRGSAWLDKVDKKGKNDPSPQPADGEAEEQIGSAEGQTSHAKEQDGHVEGTSASAPERDDLLQDHEEQDRADEHGPEGGKKDGEDR